MYFPRLRTIIYFCVLLASTSSSIQATTIVIARSETEIVVGADSKVTDPYGNELDKRACKLLQFRNVIVATEGLGTDRKTGFSVAEIVARSFRTRPGSSISERTSILTGAIVSSLFFELRALQRDDPETFSRKIGAGQIFLRIAVAGFERGRPVVFVRGFKAAPNNAKHTGVTVLADDCLSDCQGKVVTRFLGETEAIDGLPEETADFWKHGLVAGVRELIETEVTARSEYVGPPIDVVRINARGIEWIQQKPECATHNKEPKRSIGIK